MFRFAIYGCLTFSLSLAVAASLQGAEPAAKLLPASTKGFLSVPDVDLLQEKWNATQLGQMMNDPLMAPFIEDLKRQIRTKLSQTDARLGITWEDLEGVYGGEVSVAVVQPWSADEAQKAVQAAVEKSVTAARNAGKSQEEIAAIRQASEASAREEQDRQRQERRALVLLVDVTGHLEQAKALLEKVAQDLRARGGQAESVTLSGVAVTHYTLPPEAEQQQPRHVYYTIHQDQLIASDHAGVAASTLSRFSGNAEDSLQSTVAFQTVMERTREQFGDETAHLSWFVEPFGYVEVARAYEGGRRRRGTDLLRVLQNQGFDAIQGAGGLVALATEKYEIRHQSFVFAPPLAGRTDGEKYRLAANMLEFPNKGTLEPDSWVPASLSTYLTFNWKMQQAFEYARTLVDEIAGDEVFEDVLKSIQSDPNGPQINVRKELVAHLAERASMISDYRMPIDTKSERLLFAIEVTNPDAVMKTVNKAMESDPAAKRREHQGHVIWEILNDQPVEIEELKIDGFGFGFDDPEPLEDPEKPLIPNSAVTVAYGHLLVATHVDYIVEILEQPAQNDQLRAAEDYQAVMAALQQLGSGEDAFHFFSRTDDAYRPTYELVRQGKMPEAETMLGKLLNRMWEPAEEGSLREQHLDGSKLPEFEQVQKYLGPAGVYVRSEPQGWSAAGCLLTK